MDFHPAVQAWFERRFQDPSEPQSQGWPLIQSGRHVLIASPTGSGKTLAAFLCAIDQLVRQGADSPLPDQTGVLYLSPLKALANDIRQNLLEPLEQIRGTAGQLGLELPEIRPLVRTGDTSPYQRRQTLLRPPHILVTTPESFFILLTTARGKELLATVKTVIVDEIHSLAQSKRGSHLTLSLERLEALTGGFQRIGLSATQKPIEEVARFLTGTGRRAEVVDVGHRREMDVAVEEPGSELAAVASHELWQEICKRLVELIGQHRQTLVFVNTRRLAERLAHQLGEALGCENVAAHHGSLSRERRFEAERRLKEGQIKAVVATASLELGIDVGAIDLVCQIGSTRSISLALQRIGRSGHWKGAIPKGRLFPTTRDDLLECAALVRAIRMGELDRIRIPEAPLDVLAQQIVAAAAGEEWDETALFDRVRRAAPYAGLPRSDYEAILDMLSEGVSTRKGRRGAYLHRDRINGKLVGRRGARIAAVTSGGAIPDNANYLVKADPDETIVGDLDEDFAVESSRGDIFLLGNASWRIRRVESGVVRVEDARGAPPTVPFWRGEAPGRSDELSAALSEVRRTAAEMKAPEATRWLQRECGLSPAGALQAAAYIHAGAKALGAAPTRDCVVAERFFDEAGGMQLILHAPFGNRINKAWGLALRKRFCRSFNFELQAAATENGIVVSLSDQHSFSLDSVFGFLRSPTVREVLIQALLAVPLFGVRWRWTASRSLAILRFAGGKKVPPPLQRMRSDDLLASVFPEQAACLEHIHGDIELPDHPLVRETVKDCLTEAMDIEGLEQVLRRIEQGEVRCVAIDTREPSPFSHEILNANPYAYLDDAPLEERRTRAVQTRRTLPSDADELAALDVQAIQQVVEEAWPPMRDAAEVHDALLTLALMTGRELESRADCLRQLEADCRAFPLKSDRGADFWLAAERSALIRKACPDASLDARADDPKVAAAQWKRDLELDREGAVAELVRCRLDCSGPVTADELGEILSLPASDVERALQRLEAQGQILRGSFRPDTTALEWCDRRLLSRIHRLTLGRLRREIEPATPADFMRFLFRWQHAAPGTRLHDQRGAAMVLEQLQGFESAAAAWENWLLAARVEKYQPEFLDALCLSGQFSWGRLTPPSALENGNGGRRRVRPTRVAPVAFFKRRHLPLFFQLARRRQDMLAEQTPGRTNGFDLSHPAREVLEALQKWGACFFQDLTRLTGRLPVEVETGLWELAAAGLVTADGFANLRALIDPKLRHGGNRRLDRKRLRRQGLSTGRWSLLRLPGETAEGGPSEESTAEEDLEPLAWLLLRRWGVAFRDLLTRESVAPPWRDLLWVYRRLEAQGKIRGGRFVSGFAGEQFALPEALDALRALRRQPADGRLIRISASDPLNLVGIILPGERVRPHPETMLFFRDGQPVDNPRTAEAIQEIAPEGA